VTPPFPPARYKCILADPPWHYRTRGKHSGKRHADVHYPTMSLADIAALPVGDLAAEDCALFLWVTQWLTPDDVAFVLREWGFTYKTLGFVWVKLSRHGLLHWGMGHSTRQGTEQCVMATRGRSLVVAHDVHQVITAPVREHSRKPDETYFRIERLLGLADPGDKIELFARQPWHGWDAWGMETGKFAGVAVDPAAVARAQEAMPL
jgi:N6-adenosine-specific RNA methylase IME4